MSHNSTYQANAINTEFGADLSGIQAHIDDLHRIAAILLINLEDFGGVKDRIYYDLPSTSDSGSTALQAIEKYTAELEDSYNDVNTYTGYRTDLPRFAPPKRLLARPSATIANSFSNPSLT